MSIQGNFANQGKTREDVINDRLEEIDLQIAIAASAGNDLAPLVNLQQKYRTELKQIELERELEPYYKWYNACVRLGFYEEAVAVKQVIAAIRRGDNDAFNEWTEKTTDLAVKRKKAEEEKRSRQSDHIILGVFFAIIAVCVIIACVV